MTFIASVIAKEGIAVVADSFITTVENSLSQNDFIEYLKAAKNKSNIPIRDLLSLFERRASHTKNYVDKLFEFGKFSAVTITGAAYINKKEIKDIIRLISLEMQVDEAVYTTKSIEEILEEFCSKLKVDVLEHLNTSNITQTEFIFSHFNKSKNLSQIFLIKIRTTNKDKFDPADPELITFHDQSHLGIVTDGQDSFVDRLIFGSLYRNIYDLKRMILEKTLEILRPKKAKKEELIAIINHFDFLKEEVTDDMFSIKFRELSLQEAVDLAALLIKIVMDIQVYTEKIPTVGGLIRLAIIHKDTGFEWISGNNIVPSKII